MHWRMQMAQALQQQSLSAAILSQQDMTMPGGSVKILGRSRASTSCSFDAGPRSKTNSGDSFSSNGDSDEKEDSTQSVPLTTVMMRNIPSRCNRKQLLDLIDSHGFVGCYDLIYLPVDFKKWVGLGYAFINFCSTSEAERFRHHFNGFSDWSRQSSKVCEVSWSDALQGLDDNVERYRNIPVMHISVPDEFKPVLFKNGKRIPFPPPTKMIKNPRSVIEAATAP
jgi:hypothetical protein